MAVLRLTKKFSFEMAHTLHNYSGPCKNIHGHSYRLYVTITGEQITDIKNNSYGMVIDFNDIKKIVNDQIIKHFDHSLVVSSQMPDEQKRALQNMFERCIIVDYQPTCENMLIDFANRIKKQLPEQVRLCRLKLYETDSSFAEWED